MTRGVEEVDGDVVKSGQVVSLAYALWLDDGDEIDSAEAGDPLVYLHGSGSIIPGLERELEGLKVGDKRDVTVEAADAYGEVDADAFEMVPYSAFPDDVELEEGLELQMIDNETGDQMLAFISELRDDGVVLDLNHPLAGETLSFAVEIVGIRPATSEELAHGHAHAAGHSH